MDDIARRLQEMIGPKIGFAPAEVPLDSDLMNELGLDSMDVVSVITEIEEVFAPVTLREQDAAKIKTLRQLAAYLTEQLAPHTSGALA